MSERDHRVRTARASGMTEEAAQRYADHCEKNDSLREENERLRTELRLMKSNNQMLAEVAKAAHDRGDRAEAGAAEAASEAVRAFVEWLSVGMFGGHFPVNAILAEYEESRRSGPSQGAAADQTEREEKSNG